MGAGKAKVTAARNELCPSPAEHGTPHNTFRKGQQSGLGFMRPERLNPAPESVSPSSLTSLNLRQCLEDNPLQMLPHSTEPQSFQPSLIGVTSLQKLGSLRHVCLISVPSSCRDSGDIPWEGGDVIKGTLGTSITRSSGPFPLIKRVRKN